MAVAATAAFAAYYVAGLPQGYWAVFAAVMVVQSSIGATLNLSVERMIGTIAGAVVGGIAAWLHPRTPEGLAAAIAISVAVTSFGAAARPDLKVAPITAVVMLINPSGQTLGPLEAALLRVGEIGIGSLIGLLATLLIFPARARLAAAAKIRAVLREVAEMLDGCVQRLQGADLDLWALSSRIRADLGALEAAVVEAGREQSSRLADHRLPEAIGRTLWRVRNNTVVIARIADSGLPQPAAGLIGPPAAAMLTAAGSFLRILAGALESGVIDRSGLREAHDMFQGAVEALRRDRLTRDLTFEVVSPVFGIAYSVEALYRNLGDLADRIEEASGRRSPRLAPEAASRPERGIVN